MKVIVGLGNPGKKYEKTRHNIGFIVVDSLRKKYGVSDEREKFQALVSEKNIDGEKVIFLLKPISSHFFFYLTSLNLYFPIK